MDQALLPQWVLTDPEIYALEHEKIFPRTWQFLAHESELKNPGDFVTRWMVDDPVLLVKGEDGVIRAFLNSCTHRGTYLCAADSGNRRTFTCPYHGWTFNWHGDLVGVALGNTLYGAELDRSAMGLRPLPRLESVYGMIFGNLDPHAMSLREYLGDMLWYFEILLKRTAEGMEVIGVPHRWVVEANWKLTYENFTGDPYHVQSTHRSTVELGITPHRAGEDGRMGHQIVLTHGHGVNITQLTYVPPHPYQHTPESLWPLFEQSLSPVQARLLKHASVLVGGVFPTLSFVSPQHGTEGEVFNYLNFRVWRPLGPYKVEIWSWCLIDKEAPSDYKQQAYRAYVGSFGPSGTLEQDDTEMWSRVVQASRGHMVRNKNLAYNNFANYLMGYGRVEPDPTFPGPGQAYPGFVDAVSRSIHQYWFELLTADNAAEVMSHEL
ncbi:MAG: Rieske 2Fe-2S domain-containing protein [Firmicutes bacterium]|nr:Rieske 2Fe-2S domain-containing protein [Bacillota bacterium]